MFVPSIFSVTSQSLICPNSGRRSSPRLSLWVVSFRVNRFSVFGYSITMSLSVVIPLGEIKENDRRADQSDRHGNSHADVVNVQAIQLLSFLFLRAARPLRRNSCFWAFVNP